MGIEDDIANYALTLTLKEFNLNSLEEVNETIADSFNERVYKNTCDLFDSKNYKSYTISQYIMFADGSFQTRTTHYQNIYSYEELKSYMGDQDTCDVLVLNLYNSNGKSNGADYLFDENFKIEFKANTVYFNGNNLILKAKKPDKNDDYRALYVNENTQHVYVNNLTFTGFNEPIRNKGFLYLYNCTFYQNK